MNNVFNLDVHTGALSARPVDREQQSMYNLRILASDRGSPQLRSECNISIIILDDNDNEPVFTQQRYHASIPEDVPIGTTVLQVEAEDLDYAHNARLTFSLSNETQWLFKINNKTGVITTAG